MKILILTQYFPPEIGAPQNRLYELAVRLQKKGADITVLTAMPNYPQMEVYPEYRKKMYCYEAQEGLKIHRAFIFTTKSKSIFPRLINYFSFVFSSLLIGSFKLGKFDYLLCESPPLFLGLSAFLLMRMKKAKLIFNVSDLWPESAEKLGLVKNKMLLNISTWLEEFLYKNATLITGQTNGIVKNIQARFPKKKIYWLPNGVDLDLFNAGLPVNSNGWRNTNNFSDQDLLFLYAGILGHAQGLEVILKAAAQLKNETGIKFVFVGSGPEKEKLKQMKQDLCLKNVFFFNAIPKASMPELVSSVDVAIIPLKRLDLFLGAIPSKIFESLAMRKPLLLGVEGEAKALFIESGKSGLAFYPEDENDLVEKILYFKNHPEKIREMGNNGFDYVKRNFTRDKIANEFWDFLHLNN
jgi:glycosyltransferase involved in cell wall biosynthesis